jgi:ABC-type uncharacterized transport system YnjBCD substrate-binding protein
MAKIISILILVSISTLADASDWKYVVTNSEGNTFYVDAESLLIEGNMRTYWQYAKLKEPKIFEPVGKIGYDGKSLEIVDCARRTNMVLVIQVLGSKGEEVAYVDLRHIRGRLPKPIIPDTPTDAIRKYVCSIKKSAE